MSGALAALRQLAVATVGLCATFALVGAVVCHVAGWADAAHGAGWGMVGGGAIVGLATGGSGSPSDNLARARWGPFGTYWSQSAALPQSPLYLALGSLFAFAGGIALLILA
jgi:hypothetical protein